MHLVHVGTKVKSSPAKEHQSESLALEPMCGTDPFKASQENSDALDQDLGKDKHHASTTAPSSSLQNRIGTKRNDGAEP